MTVVNHWPPARVHDDRGKPLASLGISCCLSLYYYSVHGLEIYISFSVAIFLYDQCIAQICSHKKKNEEGHYVLMLPENTEG